MTNQITGFIVISIMTGLSFCEAQKRTLPAIRLAPQSEQNRFHGPLDCSMHPFSQDYEYADAVLIVSPEGKLDAVPHWNVCRVTRLLKSNHKLSFGKGEQVVVEDLPVEAGTERYLMFCRQTETGELESLDFHFFSKAAETFLTAFAALETDAQRIPFLFQHETSSDEFVARHAFAELCCISVESYRQHADVLPAGFIRVRGLTVDDEVPGSEIRQDRRSLYLALLPLVAEREDVQTLETLIFHSPEMDDFFRGQFVDPYVALADRAQLLRLSATFIRPQPVNQEQGQGFEMYYYTYRALREHQRRPEVAGVWHQASQQIVAASHVMTDIVLDDYRKIGDWRFMEDAMRLLADESASKVFQRACLMYLLQAERDSTRNGNLELAKKAGQIVSAFEKTDPKLVKSSRRLIDLLNQTAEAQPSR